ncbi:hypothetical protein ACFX2I_005349 [Malus domestica]
MFDTEEERNLSPIITLQKAYLAPELMLRAKHYTDAVDSWVCGCIIAEMCTGKRLFPHIGDKHDVDPYLRGIARVLGTITTEKWPTANQLPLWPACLPQHPEVDFTWLFPSLGVHGRDLLHGLLAYDPGKRMKNHPFFEEN